LKQQHKNALAHRTTFFDGSGKAPRYYQQNAINRSVEAIAKGQNRILLVMATGTGKTYTAFQIMHRLWKSNTKKRLLFLVDRNALISQAKRKDLSPFKDKMTVVKKKIIDKSYEIYLALYQGLTNYDEDKDAYREFSPDFFDLVVIDECHRGSAAEDSAWREILNYFSNATHIGLTATPRETQQISNMEYFGEPIYTYSLKQGIDDGFLAPYKVIRVNLNIDVEGWQPQYGETDKHGQIIENRIYNQRDYDRTLVIDERTAIVAKKVTEFLKKTSRFDKTIIFCVNIDHARRMRQAIANENSDLMAQNSKYVMQITGDNDEGKRELDNFTDPEQTYPVIATTSELMTTGIDAETCKLIILDKNIGSMTVFKQIIGRGTRINEEYDKRFFTIMDFRHVTDLFADSNFDGDPIMVKTMTEDEAFETPEEEISHAGTVTDETGSVIDFELPASVDDDHTIENTPKKYYVNGVDVTIVNERVQYLNSDGKLVTNSLKDYTRQQLRQQFQSLDDFLNHWHQAAQKKVLIDELKAKGIVFDEFKTAINKDMDIFDLICHTAFDQPPLTRVERVNKVKKQNYFIQYGEQARQVLQSLLDKYADEGIENIEDIKILQVSPLNQLGSPLEIVNLFGGETQYLSAVSQLKQAIYGVTSSL